jgi:hypothetical protein
MIVPRERAELGCFVSIWNRSRWGREEKDKESHTPIQITMRQFPQPGSHLKKLLEKMANIDLHSARANLIEIAKEAGRLLYQPNQID